MLLRLVCDDFEICKVQGETPLETITCVTRTPAPESDTDTRTRVHVTLTITCSKHYIALFSSMSFSSHRFLIEGFFNEAISIQVHMSYLLFSPQGFLRWYQRHIITIMIIRSYLLFSKLCHGFSFQGFSHMSLQ